MKLALKSLAATAVLAIASTTAFAQVVVPPQPAPGPTPSPSTENGGLIVAAWDAVRGVSLTQYLGLTLNDVRPDADMTTPGTLLDFGTLSGFGSVFGASSQSDIQYLVVAADSVGVGQAGRNLAMTINGSSTSYAINNTAATGAASAVRNFIESGVNGAGGCNGANSCIATASDQLQYAGQAAFGGSFNGQLPAPAAGTIGSVLHFAFIGQTTTAPSGAAPSVVYQAAGGGAFGEWLLSSAGQLTYSVAGAVVPLPAAVWLLLSGLAGLGAVGRRKAAA